MTPESGRVFLNLFESKRHIAAIRRHPDRSEKVIPDAERDAIVDSIAALRQFLCMVPDVHLWTVENIPQRTQWQVDIGVVEVSDGEGKQVYEDEI